MASSFFSFAQLSNEHDTEENLNRTFRSWELCIHIEINVLIVLNIIRMENITITVYEPQEALPTVYI
jgi:hypothetical protein